MQVLEMENRIKSTHDIKIFSGRSNLAPAEKIAEYLGTNVAYAD